MTTVSVVISAEVANAQIVITANSDYCDYCETVGEVRESLTDKVRATITVARQVR